MTSPDTQVYQNQTIRLLGEHEMENDDGEPVFSTRTAVITGLDDEENFVLDNGDTVTRRQEGRSWILQCSEERTVEKRFFVLRGRTSVPLYSVTDTMIVAHSEREAREIALRECRGGETERYLWYWMSPTHSSCTEINQSTKVGVVLISEIGD